MLALRYKKHLSNSVSNCSKINSNCKALIPGVSASGSDLSLDRDPSETRKEKKTVKEKITGIFKKSSSRASR